jgi:selenide, water dikinase
MHPNIPLITELPKAATPADVRLTSLSHGGGCGCKIAPAVLAEILRGSTGFALPPELLVGIETSDDAAVYQLNDQQALVATTDFFMPIVDDPYDFGRIAATNAISDIYAMGGRPIMALALVAMPVNVLPVSVIAAILRGGQDICTQAGIPIAGGHTIDSVEPIYGLVVMGLVHPRLLKRNATAQPNDILVLGKPLGVGILGAALKRQQLNADGYAALLASTTQLNTPGMALAQLPGVHAMTDVTGFGLAGHALEMARGAGLQAKLDWHAIPLLLGVKELAQQGFVTGASQRNWDSFADQVALPPDFSAADRALLTDPQTSGGLLVACSEETVPAVLELFAKQGFEQACVVGALSQGAGLRVL